MRLAKLIRLPILLLLLAGAAYPQVSLRDSSIRMGSVGIAYRGGLPGADLAGRGGWISQIGAEGGVKFRSNWYLQASVMYLFSDSTAVAGIIDPLLTPGGFVIADNGTLAEVQLLLSGASGAFTAGRIFSWKGAVNPNSGFFAEAGLQYLEHRVRIRTIGETSVAALTGPYRKGYDRLRSGIGLRQAVGYRHFANNGYANFVIGLDFSQHLTWSRRSIDFVTGAADTRRRTDLISGIYAAWIFPLFTRAPDRIYYF
ncbi:MAG: hypothetical protein NW241_01670 [Bacteroidia bacterium]|nr:hypothetical protein [Bacteroidia bacterium]